MVLIQKEIVSSVISIFSPQGSRRILHLQGVVETDFYQR